MIARAISLITFSIALTFSLTTNRARAADEETGKVQGKISLNGKPIGEGKLSFHPEKGKPIEVKVKDGMYSAKNIPAGSKKVTLEGKGIPPIYASVKTTPLSIEIKKGGNNVDFELR